MQKLIWPEGLSDTLFLQEYWQKKPLLLRQAFPGFSSPLSPAELAGLACEEGVESRLVLEKDGKSPWEVRHGPFQEADFRALPATHWTLLVQDVEKHLPELVEIIDRFNFIPAWRIDDLMISYAPDQGNVGPHVDAYDVFLLQGMGKRHWHIASEENEKNLVPNIELRILERFTTSEDWVLEPGDILYLPPGIPHYGIAEGDCMTYSIGFRAPSIQGLAESFMEHVLERISPELLYTDPDLPAQRLAHEITRYSVHRLYQMVMQQIKLEDDQIPVWLGEILSESKPGFMANVPEPILDKAGFLQCWESNHSLYRNTALRFLFMEHDWNLLFFIDSTHVAADKCLMEHAEWLCSTLEIKRDALAVLQYQEELMDLLYIFYTKGYYYFDTE